MRCKIIHALCPSILLKVECDVNMFNIELELDYKINTHAVRVVVNLHSKD